MILVISSNTKKAPVARRIISKKSQFPSNTFPPIDECKLYLFLIYTKVCKRKINFYKLNEFILATYFCLTLSFSLMNFIIPIYSYITPACSCIDSFTTTQRSDIASYGNYEIHSVKSRIVRLLFHTLRILLLLIL